MQSTAPDQAGVFVRIHSAVVLVAGSEWSQSAVESALTDFIRPGLTASQLGVGWQQKSGYQELDGLWPLVASVRGKYLLVSDDAGLAEAVLANFSRKSDREPADLLAGFNHQQERANFARFSNVVDRPSANVPDAASRRGEPQFFSNNMVEPQLNTSRRFRREDRSPHRRKQSTANRHLRMGAMRHIALLTSALLLALLPSSGRAGSASSGNGQGADSSLFAQSAAETLNRDFPSRDISFLLLDATTGRLLASRWERFDSPIPLGSLVKPFTALAYGEQHDFHYPAHICRGTATGCWLPHGHGEVGLTSAIAYSCNSYFRVLTANLTATDIAPIAASFGIESPNRDASGPALMGIGSRWQISPPRMARAYLELIRRRDQPGVREILAGMALSAQHGTGAEVDRALPFPDALVKTGTAPCTHSPRAPGDGFVVVLTPADQPQILLMVRVHGVPGAQAAKTAGQMLRRVEGRFRE